MHFLPQVKNNRRKTWSHRKWSCHFNVWWNKCQLKTEIHHSAKGTQFGDHRFTTIQKWAKSSEISGKWKNLSQQLLSEGIHQSQLMLNSTWIENQLVSIEWAKNPKKTTKNVSAWVSRRNENKSRNVLYALVICDRKVSHQLLNSLT